MNRDSANSHCWCQAKANTDNDRVHEHGKVHLTSGFLRDGASDSESRSRVASVGMAVGRTSSPRTSGQDERDEVTSRTR